MSDYVEHHELDWVQEQIYQLQITVRELESNVEQLQMENELLRNDLNTIKIEGWWRFVEDANHTHRKKDE